jgi:hypothetical protein
MTTAKDGGEESGAGSSAVPPRSLWLCSVMNSVARRALQHDQSARVVSTMAQLDRLFECEQELPFEILVTDTEFVPDVQFDTGELVAASLERLVRPPRFVIAVRTPGAVGLRSQNAFAAEFSYMVDARSTVLIADAVTHRPSVGKIKGSDKDSGIEQLRRWDDLAVYVRALLKGSPLAQSPVLPAEAVRLVALLHDRHDGFKWSRGHKVILVGLAQHDTTLLAKAVGYAPKTISNAYGQIARALVEDRKGRPQAVCCEIARDYRAWLLSFGLRSGLMSS